MQHLEVTDGKALRLDANSRVTIFWKTDLPIDLGIPSGARVTSLRVIESARDSKSPPTPRQHRVRLAENSTFDHLDLLLGSEDSTWTVSLEGERGRAHLYGLHGVGFGQSTRSHVVVKHIAPRCKSFQYYKCIASDGGKSSFGSRVVVDESATDSDAHQTNKNLLLGASSHTISEPELEIYTDAVKCSHGSTTGRLDDAALFYLRSRGLAEHEARSMLVQAFAKDVLDSLPDGEASEMIPWARSRWEAWATRGLRP